MSSIDGCSEEMTKKMYKKLWESKYFGGKDFDSIYGDFDSIYEKDPKIFFELIKDDLDFDRERYKVSEEDESMEMACMSSDNEQSPVINDGAIISAGGKDGEGESKLASENDEDDIGNVGDRSQE